MTETQKRTETIANFLMKEHGLTDKGWTFGWNKRTTSAGQCSYRKKEISLSSVYVEARDEDNTLNTIKHEIAHALVGITYHPRTGRRDIHGSEWKAKMVEIGGNPSTTFEMSVDERAKFNDHVKVVDSGPRYYICHKDTGEIFQKMRRRMSDKRLSRLHTMYMANRRAETYGKLTMMTVQEHARTFGA